MKPNKSRYVLIFLSALLAVCSLSNPALAQGDPNPDSPVPVLLSENDSTRALAMDARRWRGNLPSKVRPSAFAPGAKSSIVLFVANVEPMDGEGANAYRVFLQDRNGKSYRLPVEEAIPLSKKVYALKVLLYDQLGYNGQPPAEGDVLAKVTWRGLVSNEVKLGLGSIGGDIKESEDARPTPLSVALEMGAKKEEDAPAAELVGYRYSGDRARFMEQAAFGPSPALDDRIRRLGLRIWLAEQFDMAYPSKDPYPDVPLKPINAPSDCNGNNTAPDPVDVPPTCFRDTYSMYLPQNWFFREAFYGQAQLRHRVSWSLGQVWVISGVDTQQSRWMTEYHKVLSRNAFGNYRTLMKEMTLNPGMGNYLDMIRSTRTSPNENYAREILQLFSIGLFMLNQDGTLQLNNGQPIPTYDQNTVNNFTKVLTGWNLCQTAGASCPNLPPGVPNYIDPLLLNQANHDVTAKTLLNYPGAVNVNIPAGLNGNAELDMALDNIYNHPNVAPFVSKLLIQHLVTSDPTPAYVGRISAVFNANRTSPTQLKEVVKAILLDPEARGNIKTDPTYGKLREPVQLITNVFRNFGVSSFNGTAESDGVVNNLTSALAQNVFNSPTVFNYYPPDYVVPGTDVLGPEFAIMTTGTSIARTNVMNGMVLGTGINVGTNNPNGTSLKFDDLQAIAAADTTSNLLMDTLNWRMMHGRMAPQMRSTILTAVNAVAATAPQTRVRTAIYLIATSSQFQVQR